MQTLERESEQRLSLSGAPSGARLFARILASPLFPYAMLILLALKVMWGIWDLKDIDWGDTISYYSNACETFARGRVNIVWSPLFALFGSLILHISHEPFFYCIATRMSCTIALALLVLAVMRRLLPAGLAWFVAAWWVVLPINFNTLYAVHLFGAIPVLASWLILLGSPGRQESRWRRGCALAVMLTSGLLIRNEQCAYAGLFFLAIAAYEWSRWRKGERLSLTRFARPYLIPLAVVALIAGACYVRSIFRYPYIEGVLRYKHTNNVGQIFAYGFQQRYPGVWQKDCWRDYGELMTRYFGAPELTITEAFMANPKAMSEHLAWNASLIPSGLQLMLFDRISGQITPDYIGPRKDAAGASTLSALLLLILGAGLLKACRRRNETLRWLHEHRWGLAAMACYTLVALFVMVMQRPRVSYVFPLGIEIMGLTGFALWHLYGRGKFGALAQRCSALSMAITCLIVLPYYPNHQDGRPLLRYLEFVRPLALVIRCDNEGRVLVPKYAHEIAHYLYGADVISFERRFVSPGDLPELRSDSVNGLAVLAKNNVRDVLFDLPTHEVPSPLALAVASSWQWRLIALRKLPDRTLSLYSRSLLYEQSFGQQAPE